MATAVGLRNVEIIEEEGLVDNARTIGAYLKSQLEETLREHPYVGEIRGKGLLVGIEMVANKESKQPLAPALVGGIVSHCKKSRVLIGRNGNTVPGLSNVLLLSPPLVAQESEADQIVDALKNAIDAIA